jgi:hypothetical protein
MKTRAGAVASSGKQREREGESSRGVTVVKKWMWAVDASYCGERGERIRI